MIIICIFVKERKLHWIIGTSFSLFYTSFVFPRSAFTESMLGKCFDCSITYLSKLSLSQSSRLLHPSLLIAYYKCDSLGMLAIPTLW